MTAAHGERDPAKVGPYRLLNRLGEGGMGVVHLALDGHGTAVAVKVLRAHVAADPQARLRLHREVETLRRVQHPRVAGVLDADVDGDVPYLVTRFVPGRTLDLVVQQDGPLPPTEVARLGRCLAEAIQAIHAAGVVHRDVKPANVMLLDGEPVLIDFGIAHVAEDSRITVTGLVMGTPGYLSPEVSNGHPVAPPTDWWGWGATLAYAATGRNPYGGGPLEVVMDRVRRGQADLDGVPEPLLTALTAALAVDPQHRPPAGHLLGMLSAGPVPGGPGTAAAQPVPPAPTQVVPAPTQVVPAPTQVQASSPAARTVAFGAAATRPQQPQPTMATTTPPTLPFPQAPFPQASFPQAPFPQAPAVQAPAAQPQFAQPQFAQPPFGPSPPQYAGFPPPVRSAPVSPARASVPAPQPPAPRPPGPQPAPPPAQGQPVPPAAAAQPGGRSGVLVTAWVALSAFASVAPVLATLAATALLVVARTVDRSSLALWRRRTAGTSHGRGLAVTLLGVPWRAVMSALATVPALLLPVAAGLVTLFLVGVVPDGSGDTRGPDHPISLGVAMAVALVLAWWGFGGSSVRRGSRIGARALTPGAWGSPVAVGVLVLVVMVCGTVAAGADPNWTPMSQAPDFGGALP